MSQTENAPPEPAPQGLALIVAEAQRPLRIIHDTLTRRCYFQGLGLIYLIAFLSLWSQIHGLIGHQGLLPVERFFKLAHEKFGSGVYRLLPSLCWFGSSDLMLHVWCAVGVVLSILLMVGIAPRLALALLWVIYLSLSIAGQEFLSFQWDSLLLEMTICSFLYAPRGWRPNWDRTASPVPLARWLLWGLAFKLMFLSGITKLLSGDSAWSDGTALQFHYYTQPIPSWTSWYAAQLPLSFHRFSLIVMFLVEVFCPFLVFMGKWGRLVFGLSSIALMLVIQATGNFGFFNLQTIVLCIPLLNDDLVRRLLPRRWCPAELNDAANELRHRWRSYAGTSMVVVILLISMLTVIREMVRTQQVEKMPPVVVNVLGFADRLLLSWGNPGVLEPLAPIHSINGYGLFRVMTTHRFEIVLEISQDGINWDSCEFLYKPGNVDRAPPLVAPHMPRLDWQMWFAGLNPRGSWHWLMMLSQRILEGDQSTARLLRKPELATNPPKFVRMSYYEYKFSSQEHRRATGAWWARSHKGYLTGAQSLRPE